MADDWQDDFSTTVTISSYDEGRNYGKGRGQFSASTRTSAPSVGRINNNWETITTSSTTTAAAIQSTNNECNFSNCEKITNDNWDPTSQSNGNWESTSQSNDNWEPTSQSNDNWEPTSQSNDWESEKKIEDWASDKQTFDDAEESNHGENRDNRYGRRGRDHGQGERRGGDKNRNRNGNHSRSRNYNNDNGEEKKPPVTYIPPERSMDDADLFSKDVTAGINFNKYDNIKVEVTGGKNIASIDSFEMMGLRSILLKNIEKSGYVKPTPVQKYSIPIMMEGFDVMACAQTGSGKTAAYLIPIIHKLLENNEELHLIEHGCEPQVIIMAPTRELVTQICKEAHKFAKDTIIKSIEVYGGVATTFQARQIELGAHIIVATPGRLCDFVARGRIKFGKIRFIVLDEADRMLDQGFLKSMETILDHETMVAKENRQTVLYSATFPSEIQNLSVRFMRNYLFLRVGIVGGACENVEQHFYEVEKGKKRKKLQELLKLDGGVALTKKTLVFVEMKKTADFIAAYMSDNHFPSTSIHGDREQREREIALNDFKTGRMPILIATSVAARGLDIPKVAHVINYDLPKCIDEYVHRIGRTGRIGNEGKATSFYDPTYDSALAPALVHILKQANKKVPEFLQGVSDGGFTGGKSNDFGGYDIRSDNVNNAAYEPEEQW